MGPDEYHERYPGRDEPGLDNNAYTNVMAVWCLCRAFDVLDVLPPVPAAELRERLALTEQELDRWGDISREDARLLPRRRASASSRATTSSRSSTGTPTGSGTATSARLDRILEAEGDSTEPLQARPSRPTC